MTTAILSSAQATKIDWSEFDNTVGIFLEKNSGRKTVCTGILLNPRVVLTAAHCAVDLAKAYVTNDSSMHELSQKTEVKNWVINPNYSGNDVNRSIDLSLMFLTQAIHNVSTYSNFADFNWTLSFERIGFGLRNGKNKRTFVTSFFKSQLARSISVTDVYGYPGDSGGPVYQRMHDGLKLIGVHTGRGIFNSSVLNNSYVQLIGREEIIWINETTNKETLTF
jgi:V8-like Glu-specific endopeptidase